MKITNIELRHILRHSRWFLPELVLQCKREHHKRLRPKSLIIIDLDKYFENNQK